MEEDCPTQPCYVDRGKVDIATAKTARTSVAGLDQKMNGLRCVLCGDRASVDFAARPWPPCKFNEEAFWKRGLLVVVGSWGIALL